jgi:membrane-bound metal-dependent hydrolase YbcI (DUF457 family)
VPEPATVEVGRGALAASGLAILGADALLKVTSPPIPVKGLADWAAHEGAVIITLAALPGVTRTFAAGALAGGVLIDLDHLPQYAGSDVITAGTPRPYPHSLLTLGALLTATRRSSAGRAPRFLAGASLGLATHFLRDMATPDGSGVSLLWPATSRPVRMSYAAYTGVLALLFAVGWRRTATITRPSVPATVPSAVITPSRAPL